MTSSSGVPPAAQRPHHEPSAPQQAAGHLLPELHAEAGDRGFLRTLLAVFLGLSVVVAAAALLLDPLGSFGTGLAPPLLWRDRDEKAEAFLRREPRPELIVMGSSHMMKLRPACLSELSGLRAFNFAVSAARAEDFRAIQRFAEESSGGALKRIVIGLDPEALHNGEEPAMLLLASRRLRAYAGGGSALGKLGPDLLSQQVALASMRSAHGLLSGASRDAARLKSFDADGFIRYLKWEPEAKAGRLPLLDNIRGSIRDYRRLYRTYTALDPGRVATLREMLRSAHERGVEVWAYVPPLHPRLLRALASLPTFGARRAETVALLRGLEAEGLLRFFPLDTLESFGGDPAQFFDGEHMQEANVRRLLLKMHGKAEGCALQ